MYSEKGSVKVSNVDIKTISPILMNDIMEKNFEFWTGRRVLILNDCSKYKGLSGVITRSIKNWAQVCLDNSRIITMERTRNLFLYQADDGEDVFKKEMTTTPSTSRKRWSERSSFSENDRKVKKFKSTTSSSIMWIDRMVVLPDKSTGVVKSVDHGVLLVEVTLSKKLLKFKKEELSLCKEGRTDLSVFNANLDTSNFIPVPVHGDGFPEQAKRHVQKLMEVFKKRPNIKNWTIKINAEGKECGREDLMNPLIPDLKVVVGCIVCGIEKERQDDSCWNERCPVSTVYRHGEEGQYEAELRSETVLSTPCTFRVQTPVKTLLSRKRRFVKSEDKYLDPASYRMSRRGGASTESLEAWKNLEDKSLKKEPEAAGTINTTTPALENGIVLSTCDDNHSKKQANPLPSPPRPEVIQHFRPGSTLSHLPKLGPNNGSSTTHPMPSILSKRPTPSIASGDNDVGYSK